MPNNPCDDASSSNIELKKWTSKFNLNSCFFIKATYLEFTKVLNEYRKALVSRPLDMTLQCSYFGRAGKRAEDDK